MLAGDMDDAITLRTSKQIIEQVGHGFATILQSPQYDRQPTGEVSLREAYRKARRQEGIKPAKGSTKYCVGCGEWRDQTKFSQADGEYIAGEFKPYGEHNHLSLCVSCEALYSRPPAGHKRCTACHTVKPHQAFSPDKRMRDGHYSQCKRCFAEGMRKRYHDSKRRQVA